MPRPINQRVVAQMPEVVYYKPRGVPMSALETVVLTVDEFEALRLANLNGLYQNDAAESMNVSRQTFGRIITSANKKIADALVNGKAIKIQGGKFEIAPNLTCSSCGRKKRHRHGKRSGTCPKCE